MITTIGVDGDDTLWHSENHFQVTTERFVELLAPWIDRLADQDGLSAEDHLIQIERRNLALLGYGVKAFTLSMIETAIEATRGEIPASSIEEIIGWGRELLEHPVDLLDGVDETLRSLSGSFDLVLVTKGDLLHQESKISQSGIEDLFAGIEIVSEKDPATYRRVLTRRGVAADQFVMVGNSVRSDVLPVLEIGGRAVHVPYHVTWALEHPDPVAPDDTDRDQPSAFASISSVRELPDAIRQLPN
ncbi:HAD family hydrolase [soil metagenome]